MSLGLCLVACALLVGMLGLGASCAAAAHAQGGADLAAIAGAQALQAGQAPCPVVAAAAARNGVTVASCQVFAPFVQVEVIMQAKFGHLQARARARAGPKYAAGES